DDIGSLTGEQVQDSKLVLIRPLRFSVVCRKRAQGFPRTGNQRCGLDRSHTHLTQHFKSSAGENWALYDIFDDDAFSSLKRHGAGALAPWHVVPEIDPPLRESAVGRDP